MMPSVTTRPALGNTGSRVSDLMMMGCVQTDGAKSKGGMARKGSRAQTGEGRGGGCGETRVRAS
eukprot:2648908-Rhodomonas_salina.2